MKTIVHKTILAILILGIFSAQVAQAQCTTLCNNTGLAGGTTLIGGTAASENLTLTSTSHATKGNILLGTNFIYRNVVTDAIPANGSALSMTVTHPSSTTNGPVAVYFSSGAVTQGSGINEIQTMQLRMTGAATGTVTPITLSVGQENTGGGTITAFPAIGTASTGLACNNAAFFQANGTTSGDNIGGIGRAGNGAKNYGLVGIAAVSDANINVGVFGNAVTNSGKQVGGYFQLGTSIPTLSN